MIPKDRKIKGVVFLAALISCFIAFVNNYPLVFGDTGIYIYSGFEGSVPIDRPIFYGLFIKYISFSYSFWYVVFIQGLIISYLIYLTLGLFFEGFKRSWLFISSITFLTLFTGFSFNVSVLTPDIFAATSVLCLVNLLLNKTLIRIQVIFISLLFVFSICVQYSSFVTLFLLLGICGVNVIFKITRKKKISLDLKRLGLSFALCLSSFFITLLTHYSYNKQSGLSENRSIFMLNYFVKTGVLDEYLFQNCRYHVYKICQYKKQGGADITWSPENPLQKPADWETNKDEYKIIIKELLTRPEYIQMSIQKGIEASLKQFFTFDNLVVSPQLSSTGTFEQIELHYKNSLRDYYASLQSQRKMGTDFINAVQGILVMLSLVFLLVVILTPALSNKLSFALKITLTLIMLHTILNAVVCSNLSAIYQRSQNRVAWLLPLCVIIVVAKFIEFRRGEVTLNKIP